MTITVRTKSLRRALTIARKATARKPTLAVLKTVQMRLVDGKLEITGTNLDLGARITISDVEVSGDFNPVCIDPTVVLSSLKGAGRYTKLGNFQNATDVDEFPGIRFDGFVARHAMNNIDLSVISNHFATATINHHQRASLRGVYLEEDGNDLIVTATDGFRLHHTTRPGVVRDGKMSLLVPGEFWALANAAFSNHPDIIEGGLKEVYEDDPYSYGLWGCGQDSDGLEIMVIGMLIHGKFPDYRPIMPTSYRFLTAVNVADLERELVIGASLKDSGSTSLISVLKFEGETLHLTCIGGNFRDAPRYETTVSVRPLEMRGNGWFAVNTRFLLDAIKLDAIKQYAGEVAIQWSSEREPIVFQVGRVKKIVMPVRFYE